MSLATLCAQLVALGVRPADHLMVHASMSKVGVDAKLLLNALDAVVGPQGGLFMLISAPEEEVFNPALSPAWEELGVLNEVFRQRPSTRLNTHPIARFGASGPRAQTLVQNPPLDDYYGPGSPLARFIDVGGRVLRLGADTNTVTLFHHAEYLAKVANKRRAVRPTRVHQGPTQAPRVIEVHCLDDEQGIRELSAEQRREGGDDYFSWLLADYLATGQPKVGEVGECQAELLDAQHATEFAKRWLELKFP